MDVPYTRDEIRTLMSRMSLPVDDRYVDETVSAYGYVRIILERARRSWPYLSGPANDFDPVNISGVSLIGKDIDG